MTRVSVTADGQLQAIIARIERLEEEKKTIGDDITDVYAEAKSSGYDVKALKAIVKERKQNPAERAEHESILQTYRRALGMLDGTPLGNAAIERATSHGVSGSHGQQSRSVRMAG
jgi:uncharacterized protein (UPF0335 family)